MIRRAFVFALAALLLPVLRAAEPIDPAAELARRLDPFLSALGGKESSFRLRVEGEMPGRRRAERVALDLVRIDDRSFTLAIDHAEYPLRLERTAERTLLVLPARKVSFEGTGPVEGADVLDPQGIAGRLTGPGTAIAPVLLILTSASGTMAAPLLTGLAGLRSEDGKAWTATSLNGARISFGDDPPSIEVEVKGAKVKAVKLPAPGIGSPPPAPPEGEVRKVDRTELERLLVRGGRRGLEVLAPSPRLVRPAREGRTAAGGKLGWVEDGRLVILDGSYREIGAAHGKLLAEEARRCADSVLYLVGAAQTANTGRWFLDDMRDAYRRLEPHLTAGWKEEVDGLAEGAGIGLEEARLANIFPELFHCSGFAVFGKATVDGKLYHGRVLDYMTEIGLQDSAATFVVHVKGKIPFANVGYAGFVGSVSGMNARKISLGEMGGRGEGKWDGVPMAALMRRALEECSTLEEVKRLWKDSPRTCEYYYVFADGNIPDAVGVGATPEKIEFIESGEDHPLLGKGIPDAVVLSAGDRLEELRKRVIDNAGKIDVEKAKWLMTRPVAMRSNLHDVLFVPQDLILYVANADRSEIAANRPYVKYDLGAILAKEGLGH